MKFEIGQPCTPAIETTLENLGERHLFIVNGGGGMGGSREEFVGVPKPEASNNAFFEIELTESKRRMKLGHEWIGRSEKVTLYKRIHRHNNDNVENPFITYFITKGNTELVLANRLIHSTDELKNTKNMVEKINWEKC